MRFAIVMFDNRIAVSAYTCTLVPLKEIFLLHTASVDGSHFVDLIFFIGLLNGRHAIARGASSIIGIIADAK